VKEIKAAVKRAEKFLSKVTKVRWESAVKKEKGKLTLEGWYEWPLRFEAQSYLCEKNDNLKHVFAHKIRNLWRTWIRMKDNGPLKYSKVFWPAAENYCIPISHEEAEWEPAYEIESHLAMFRAREIFSLDGFEKYFNEVKRRLQFLISEDDVLNNNDKNRIIWQLARSPLLRKQLKDNLKVLANRIIDENFLEKSRDWENDAIEARRRGVIISSGSCINTIFLFILSDLGDEYYYLAKKMLEDYINTQEENGSFNENILTTCLCIASLKLTGLDPQGIIIEDAMKWLISKQKKDGSWEYWRISVFAKPIEADIFATVFVLEVLDLVLMDRGIPFWVGPSLKKKYYTEKRGKNIQPFLPFDTPEGINWHDVTITFLSEHGVHIRAGSVSEGKDFIQMGFVDRRGKTQERIPDMSWLALREIAKNQGEISVTNRELPPRIRKNLKTYIYNIRKQLIALFGINEDPFKQYNRNTKSWRAKFSILDHSQE
jgi:hypothetical protein